MKRVLTWTGGMLVAMVVLAGSAHAATSVEGHENGDCITCNICACLHSLFHG